MGFFFSFSIRKLALFCLSCSASTLPFSSSVSYLKLVHIHIFYDSFPFIIRITSYHPPPSPFFSLLHFDAYIWWPGLLITEKGTWFSIWNYSSILFLKPFFFDTDERDDWITNWLVFWLHLFFCLCASLAYYLIFDIWLEWNGGSFGVALGVIRDFLFQHRETKWDEIIQHWESKWDESKTNKQTKQDDQWPEVFAFHSVDWFGYKVRDGYFGLVWCSVNSNFVFFVWVVYSFGYRNVTFRFCLVLSFRM